ncbi:hypothetical protein ACKKBG_A04770 [Auxenochlorella protothecoides x Auxenochlorella symbiontica]
MDLPMWRPGDETQQYLAAVLGDDGLLRQWHDANPEEAERGPSRAPPAAIYEAEERGGSAAGYAAAALAGLPPDDDAVRVARLAAGVGKSIQEVVAWNHGSGEYTTTALHSRGRGRVSAPGQESLYGELGSWGDPESMPAQLAAAAAARKRRPTPAQLAELRRSKQEAKRAKQTAWLFA